MREPLFFLAPLGVAAALLYACQNAVWLEKRDTGDMTMARAGVAIREGVRRYLTRLYSVAAPVFALVFFVLAALERQGHVERFTPWAFLTGGVFSALAGYIGTGVSTRAGLCTAAAARNSLSGAMKTAVAGGAAVGLAAAGLGLAHMTGWYVALDRYYTQLDTAGRLTRIGSTLMAACLGSSIMALLARVGGGIYAKAADLGADRIRDQGAGKGTTGLNNPVAIAENVGKNLGDVAGMGADLFESYGGALAAAAILSVPAGLGEAGFLLPMGLAALGAVAGVLGLGTIIRWADETEGRSLHNTLYRGIYLCAGILAVAAYPLVVALLGTEGLGIYGAMVSGLAAGIILSQAGEYYMSAAHPETEAIVREARTGSSSGVMLQGLTAGMRSTLLPVTVVGATLIVSYYLGGGGEGSMARGLYGVGLAAAGMVSTLGIILAAGVCRPVSGNAVGIAEMAGMGEETRRRTGALEGLGNVTAAAGKGYALGSAVLTAVAMIASLGERVRQLAPLSPDGTINIQIDINLLNPPVQVGLFLGGMLAFVFSAASLQGVGRTAGALAEEAGQKMQGTGRSGHGDEGMSHHYCVELCTRRSIREMFLPAGIALLAPVGAGLILGIQGLFGLLAGITATGFVLAMMMTNAGGAWDNARKNIAAGFPGGAELQRAVKTGGMVGGAFQEAAGPSLGIVMKLATLMALVLASVVMQYALIR